MLNLQLAEKPERVEDGSLDVHSIFPTIQGEGPFAGTPAIFIRLAGCNLQCPGCDTDYTTDRRVMTLDQICDEILKPYKSRVAGLVVLTGGEPLRQTCGPLIRRLTLGGLRVQIETNGTLFDQTIATGFGLVHRNLTVVCSPKTPSISEQMHNAVTHLKYILKAGEVDEKDGLPTSSLNYDMRPCRPWGSFRGNIYVQPMDEQDELKNAENVKAAIDSCMRFGYTLCLQLHKLAGLP